MLSDQSSSSFHGGHWHIQTTDKACNKITKEKSAKRSEFQFRCLYLTRIECQIKNVLRLKEHLWIVLIKISFRKEELNHICHKIKLTLGDRIMELTDTFLVLWVLYRCANDPRTANDFPNCTANYSRTERMEMYGLKNLDSGLEI